MGDWVSVASGSPVLDLLEHLPGLVRRTRRPSPLEASARAAKPRERLVIVGNGMVGQRLCERLVERGLSRRLELAVIGEEPTQAYDRVHLTDVLKGRPSAELLLRAPEWYLEHGIELLLGDAAHRIDRDARKVHTASGRALEYDRLVLATGSRAVVPPLPVEDGVELLAYRTLADAERILSELSSCHGAEHPIVVIGAGLLGIEAARTLELLGLSVVVLETASQLLPRQLDPEAAAVLQGTLESAGLSVRLRSRVVRIGRGAGGVRLELDDGSVLDAAAVVAAAGARPADDLAREAGLRCRPRGGVEVDGRMRSSDARIHAVGECASHAGVPHGLVAPGYAMADVLASLLAGRRAALDAQEAVTRLKLDLTEVTVLGSPADCPRDREVVFRAPGVYRRLLVAGRRVVAAIVIGTWNELPGLQRLVTEGRRCPGRTLESFEKEGTLGDAVRVSLSVLAWPEAAVVCQCANVSRGALTRAVVGGAVNVEALGRATSAGTLCGSCRPLLAELAGDGSAAVPAPRGRSVAVASVLALLFTIVTLLVPRIPLPASLRAWTFQAAWTDPTVKQITGYATLGAIVIGLSLSLRKRIERFKLGSYASFRSVHTLLGMGALVALFVHTGLRLGENLNLVLALVVLAGALTGAASGLAPPPPVAGTPSSVVGVFSRFVKHTHDVAFWLFVPLVAFHVLKTYFY